MPSLIVALFSGFILSASFPLIGLWAAAPVGLALFYYSVSKTRHPYFVSFAFGLIFNLITLSWSGKYVGVLPWVLLSLLQSLFFIPLGLISWKRSKETRIWLYPPLFLLLEELRTHIPFGGFGWNRIAYSQIDAPYSSIVRLGGVGSLTLLTLYLALLMYHFASKNFSSQSALVVLVITCASIWPISSESKSTISILAIQGDVPEVGLEFNARAKEVFYNHVRETEKALKEIDRKPDVIVWPENAVDVDPFTNRDVSSELSNIVDKSKVPLIIGAVLNATDGLLNASIKWEKNAESIYIKRHLTPFGEYIPLRSIAEKVSPYAKDVTDFRAGNKAITHSIKGIKIGPIICYELIDDSTVASMAAKSQVLLVQTNSATFAQTAESRQQLAITRLRALEFDRSAISISTTGVSAFVDKNGEVKDFLDEGRAGYLFMDAGLDTSQTPAGRLGGWLTWINIALGLLLAASARIGINADKLHYVK